MVNDCSRNSLNRFTPKEINTVTLPTYLSPSLTQAATSLRSKVAIVTGASSGIGLEVTKKLTANGYRVVANSRHITSAMTLSETSDLKLMDGDISLQETAQRVVATAIHHFGSIDLLVNNAGIFISKPFTEYTAEDFLLATATNLSGFFMYRSSQCHRCVFRNRDILSM